MGKHIADRLGRNLGAKFTPALPAPVEHRLFLPGRSRERHQLEERFHHGMSGHGHFSVVNSCTRTSSLGSLFVMETFRAIGRRNLIILALAIIFVATCFALSRWVFEHGTDAHAFTEFCSVVGLSILVSLSALWLIRRRLGRINHRPSNDVM